MAYLQDQNYYNRPGRYEPGLTAYAANNATAMAAPFELNPDDIARLDEDISTHAFKDHVLAPRRPPSPFKQYNLPQPSAIDKENVPYYNEPRHGNVNFGLRAPNNRNHDADLVGRLAADIAGPPSSDPYCDLSPLQLRRSTSDLAKHKVITPPTSSSPEHERGLKYKQQQPQRRPLENVMNYNSNNFTERILRDSPVKANSTFEELQQVFEQRLDLIKKTESEKYATLEIEYKRQIAKLQSDLDMILKRQEDMMSLKKDSDVELQRDLEAAKLECKREHELRKQEKSKYDSKIRELQQKIDELQKRLKRYATSLDCSEPSLSRKYESRISELQQEYDQKTSNLIKQFEREKQSALQILKTRIKSEINLLVPRIRQQCQSAFNQALTKCQEQTAQRYRDKYGGMIKRLKEEHQAEKKFIQKQAKEDAEQEKVEWQRKMKAKYEMKALELKNECERRMIDRMRSGRSKPSNVSFISDLNNTNNSLYSTDLEQSSFLF